MARYLVYEPRACTICGDEIPINGRYPSDYVRVHTCSPECHHRLLVINGRKQSPLPHPCAICGNLVLNPRQATCGPRCRGIYISIQRSKPLERKRCKVCRRVLHLDESLLKPKHRAERSAYRRKQTCSHACARILAGRTHSATDASVRQAVARVALKLGISLADTKRMLRSR